MPTTAVTATTPKRSRGAGQAHTRRDWRARHAQVFTAVPRSCVSRRSPAVACRLARTDRYALEGPNHHANRVDGRGWASGAHFGALAIVMVVGGTSDVLSPYFHALKGFQSNWSVAKAGFCNFFATFFATSRQFCNRRTVSERPRTPRNDGVRLTYVSFYVGST